MTSVDGELFVMELMKTGDADYRRYRHAITNAKTRIQQPETGGGILADEMGMGKSLSILALITKTLDNASRWANEPKLSPPAADVLENRSQATLVIVPSASMFQRSFLNP